MATRQRRRRRQQQQQQQQQQPTPRVENDECPICLESVAGAPASKTMKLPCKMHRYHRECVRRHVAHALEKRDCPVPCVVEGCGAKMTEAQVQMFLTAAKMEDYLAILEGKRIAADPSQTPCPTPGCLGALSKKEGARGKPVACSKCGKAHVLGKKTPEDEALDRLAASEQLRLCPGCQVYIEPRGGCPKMTCVCGCKFCVICGWVKDDGRGRVAPEKTCACKSGKSHAFPLWPESDRGPAPRLARFEEEQALADACKRVRDGEVVPRTTRSGKRARSD